MAGGRLIIRVRGAGADSALERLRRATADMRPAYAAVGRVVLSRVQMCFRSGQSPWGDPWAPLRFRAIRRNNAGTRPSRTGRAQARANQRGAAGQPLRDTGRLMRSFVAQPDSSGVTVGTQARTQSGVPYAAVHQFGATIFPKKGKFLVFPGPDGGLIFAKRVRIPARPFLPQRAPGAPVILPPQWVLPVVQALRGALVRATSSNGSGAGV